MGTVAKTKSNLKKCICMKCPSYTFACKIKEIPSNISDMLKMDISDVKHAEVMFCAFEASKCIKEEKGCNCPSCAVHAENMLDKTYYCLGRK